MPPLSAKAIRHVLDRCSGNEPVEVDRGIINEAFVTLSQESEKFATKVVCTVSMLWIVGLAFIRIV